MKKILSIVILTSFFLINSLTMAVFTKLNPIRSFASVSKNTSEIQVKAKVGQFYLDVSGFVSPYASIVMNSNDSTNTFLSSAVANRKGDFNIPSILIQKGFSGFCLIAIDFKRLGESTTCFSFSPATGNIVMRNIFLPPTLGLAKSELAEGSDAIVYGYTMPQAVVILYLDKQNSKPQNVLGASQVKYLVSASEKGYYKFSIKKLKAGEYQLFAKATYKNQESSTPSKQLKLKMLSLWEQLSALLRNAWNIITGLFTGLFGSIWLTITLIILIIILAIKLWPKRFAFIISFIENNKFLRFLLPLFKKKKKRS